MASSQEVRPVSGQVPTYEFELELTSPVNTAWIAMKNANKFIAEIAPEIIASVEDNVGTKTEPGDTGITRTVKFGSSAPEGAYKKDKILIIDDEARTIKTEEVEGGHLTQGFTKFTQTATVNSVSGSSSKSVVKFLIEYAVDETKIKEVDVVDHLEKTKQLITTLTQLTEKHVQKSGQPPST